ncbi:TPA: helix-turn-helix domain-containing protein [Streptococcus agalactiae]|uniref:helix-turn-helix domain-containing protein n=1 Tax=Streptococcus agalactiae TaxID=1311 RepID=UPI0002BACFA7|nr:helix-turn-helix domain-containing protein [Streptococcus agalactiae]EPT95545.1 repressor [Streptococcus agalactiae BSU188]HEM9618163.1 helix-turn-helix domain-containing protein [Streptococcus agalactiae]HEM9676553.1 helix-turn-helix domain-containing protein [Streptococcus agalactiae]HEN6106106.1 helix-turn-helix domain-containing protein [Streptococcus agalactiae]HEN6132241.1 helix-turn-helix domain-containing protein [Streptococcus agalactiae]
MRQYTTADRLKQIMSEKNLKQVDIIEKSKPFQAQLSVKLGKSALSQYVNGIQSPDQHKLSLLAMTLDVSEAWLMGYDVQKDRGQEKSSHTSSVTDTPQLRSIQRKAKSLSVADQERLLQLMDLTFQDVLSGGGDNEHDL